MKRVMTFRQWCYEKWMEHCDEIESVCHQRVVYMSKDYFSKYKWWLKREYSFYVKNTPNES